MTSTYDVTLFDGGSNVGDTEITAASISEAWDKAETWAQGGDWDHPGSVDMSVSGPDGDMRESVSVGA